MPIGIEAEVVLEVTERIRVGGIVRPDPGVGQLREEVGPRRPVETPLHGHPRAKQVVATAEFTAPHAALRQTVGGFLEVGG